MTSKDLSIFNSLRPFSIGFDDMFDQFESMLGNGSLAVQSNYPPYNIRKAGKDKYAIEVAVAGFNKNDVEVEYEDNLLTVKTKEVKRSEEKDYPSMLITTSLFDNRVLYSEPVKYIAKLRDVKTDNNNQLLKCKMEAAGHGGMSGRDNAITELSEEYSFIIKSAKILY